jgi:hypothetical protein
MSGGAAVKAGDGAKGDHPVCTERQWRKIGETPRRRPKGLGLDSPGTAGPLLFRKGIAHSQPSAKGCPIMKSARDRHRMAETPVPALTAVYIAG